jgi:hypothetical protein
MLNEQGEIEGRQGAWAYPEGGMGGVSSAMAKSAVANGARIYTDQVPSLNSHSNFSSYNLFSLSECRTTSS